ncbi:hypothetical protein BKE38_26625 [Pseudoroseomonas deserti]|uniref:Molybdopterin-guanine dinucleotide biosynthesis protein MobB n=1 Tax=Teichococcus deserti TaxID=1817963 RepID=A0A1V2GV97_9PROT|nr:DUF2889 domain-containing protein [Pseudoroseomonas deserti]ONG45274.1 hypothetical protein BKE38_26625 [Pseudoroseomonas deserti]
MPLSPPAARRPLHRRVIDMRGYAREDGLFDIEGHLVDTKDQGFSTIDRVVAPDEPLHGMRIRLTIDDEMLIHECEAVTEQSPYRMCPDAAPNFARLAGLRIGGGFNRAVAERVGGTLGCTHLREMLAQLATVAFQTTYESRRAKRGDWRPGDKRPALIGTCLAYAEDSRITATNWPGFAPEPAGPAKP